MISNYEESERGDLAHQLIVEIQKHYGKQVERTVKFEPTSDRYTFDVLLVFTDYRILEGQIRIEPRIEGLNIRIDGVYL
jgi:hypothetical protein